MTDYVESVEQSGIRRIIYENIKKFPGIHFRELLRKSDIAVGQLSHHLAYLEKLGTIKEKKYNGFTRFFPQELKEHDRNLLSVLRNKNSRKILLKLLETSKISHKEMVNYLKLSPSTVTWYLERLNQADVVIRIRRGKQQNYYLKNKEELVKILQAYKESFLDKLVNKFIETWER